MSYEYTDVQGLKLRVQSRDNYGWDCVEIGAHTDDGTFWRAFKVEDAPAVALAILEAAGMGVAGKDNLTSVLDGLRTYATEVEELRAEQAEREAEDAKVREWLSDLIGFQYDAGLDDAQRKDYRKHRSFWEKHIGTSEEIIPAEVVEPRVIPNINYLYLRHQDSEWQDAAGCLWEHTGGNWRWRPRPDGGSFVFNPESFPWTEVL